VTARALITSTLCGVLLLGACASGGGGSSGPGASDEMKLGIKAAKRGYWQEALTRFQRADEKKPHNADVLNNMAVALEAVGRYDDALRTYELAMAIDPSSRNLRRNLVFFNEFYDSYIDVEEELEEPDETEEDSVEAAKKAEEEGEDEENG